MPTIHDAMVYAAAPHARPAGQAPPPGYATADQYLADLTTWADHVVEGVCPLIQAETFEAAAARRWHAGTHLLEDDRPALQRLGYVLVLDALVASPDVVGQALQALRRALVQYDPALALMQ